MARTEAILAGAVSTPEEVRRATATVIRMARGTQDLVDLVDMLGLNGRPMRSAARRDG
jgi:hypothetical protein